MILWLIFLRFFAPEPPPPPRRWTMETWEQRCLGRVFQRYQDGYLPLEQAARMAFAYRSEYRYDSELAPCGIKHGSLAGSVVPAEISWRMIVHAPGGE